MAERTLAAGDGHMPGIDPKGPGGSEGSVWGHFLGMTARWGWWLLACPLVALLLQGVASSVPIVSWGFPFTVAGTAILIAWVSLRRDPYIGAMLAAWIGLSADASGPALPGAGTWAYILVPLVWVACRRYIRDDAALPLIIFAGLQTVVQTFGGYLGLRFSGVVVTPVHRALVTTLLTALVTVALVASGCLIAAFVSAFRRNVRK